MIKSKVSADQYRVTISRAQVKSPLTKKWVFDSIAASSQVITLGEGEGEHAKAKFR